MTSYFVGFGICAAFAALNLAFFVATSSPISIFAFVWCAAMAAFHLTLIARTR